MSKIIWKIMCKIREKETIGFGIRPVHVKEHHVDKTLLVKSQPFVLSRSWLGRESHRRRHHHYLEKKIGNQSSSNEEEGVDRIGTLRHSLKRHTSLSKDSRLWNFVWIYGTIKKLIHRQESFVALPELFCKFYLICFNMEMIGMYLDEERVSAEHKVPCK